MDQPWLVDRSVSIVTHKLREYRYAEACLFLFHLNKAHPQEWACVSGRLLSETTGSRLSMLASIIDCSTRSDLSSCDNLVPGLSLYSRRAPVDLFD